MNGGSGKMSDILKNADELASIWRESYAGDAMIPFEEFHAEGIKKSFFELLDEVKRLREEVSDKKEEVEDCNASVDAYKEMLNRVVSLKDRYGILIRDHARDKIKLKAERDDFEKKYLWMCNNAANEKLDGYRKLGQRAADAENRCDELERLYGMSKRTIGRLSASQQSLLREISYWKDVATEEHARSIPACCKYDSMDGKCDITSTGGWCSDCSQPNKIRERARTELMKSYNAGFLAYIPKMPYRPPLPKRYFADMLEEELDE
jgi:hypothetical protein